MKNPQSFVTKFFGIAIQGQTYLNLVYLFLAFPLGLLYFVLLTLGLSLGFGLLILWVGAIILAMTFVALWACAVFECQLAVWLLHEEIPPMKCSAPAGTSIWDQIKSQLADPVTWKSLAYLLVKFPLGILSFVVLVTLTTLTLGFLSAPAIYPLLSMEILHVGSSVIYIDAMWKAIICFFVGVVLFFPTLHIFNGLAWISGRFAKAMLS
jgi:rubredoxin